MTASPAGKAGAWSEVERVARDTYGRLVANLAYRWRDIAAAEDAFADALAAALVGWRENGVPDNPEGWLTAAATNRLREVARHRKVEESAVSTLLEIASDRPRDRVIPDHRLNLLFACAHPAIDPPVRTPLMLQVVLGLDAARVAEAFLVSAPAMSQRLVRAKQKIRDAGIPFDPPEPREVGERVGAVLEAIYAIFGTGWNDALDGAAIDAPLEEEALFLARLVCSLLPEAPEPLGLLALLTFSHARRSARLSPEGMFVPLAEQDTSQWDRQAIESAEVLLTAASAYRQPGPFQLEAAIQSAHCQRLFSGSTPWRSIALLYEALIRIAPSTGSHVAYAAALVECGRLFDAGALLDSLDRTTVEGYQPFWVVRAHLAQAQGSVEKAKSDLARAIARTKAPPLRRYLEKRQSYPRG